MSGDANPLAPEDALVVAEVLRRVRDAVGDCTPRADGNVNLSDLYVALHRGLLKARKEANDV